MDLTKKWYQGGYHFFFEALQPAWLPPFPSPLKLLYRPVQKGPLGGQSHGGFMHFSKFLLLLIPILSPQSAYGDSYAFLQPHANITFEDREKFLIGKNLFEKGLSA